MTLRGVIRIGGAIAALLAGTAAAVPRYVAVQLSEQGRSFGAGINSQGDSVGYVADLEVGYFSFVNTGGVTRPLTSMTFAAGINDLRQIVGYEELNSPFPGPRVRGVIDSGGELRYIGFDHYPAAINAEGQVTGQIFGLQTSNDPHFFLYARGAGKDLGLGVGHGINDAGQGTGEFLFSGQRFRHAAIYSVGTFVDLGVVGWGSGINRLGQVAGTGLFGVVDNRAFLYADGIVHELGTLGGQHSGGWGINDRGHVVGQAHTDGNASVHAFLYAEGKMHDLNDLVVSGSERERLKTQWQSTTVVRSSVMRVPFSKAPAARFDSIRSRSRNPSW